jgi:hypothetical protein
MKLNPFDPGKTRASKSSASISDVHRVTLKRRLRRSQTNRA